MQDMDMAIMKMQILKDGLCDSLTQQSFKEAIDMAIVSMEKQIPKKPIENKLERYEVRNDGIERWNVAYLCPRCKLCCGSNISYSHAFKYPTCQCGQKIDWSESDED